MSNLREAAQRLLKALDDFMYMNDYSGLEVSKHDQPTITGEMESMREALAQPDDDAQPVATEPMFWVRILKDGLYEGPVHNNSIGGKMLRDEKPSEWLPLFLGAAPQPPAEQPFQPDWMNYKQGFEDGKAEAEQGAELSDSAIREAFRKYDIDSGGARHKTPWQIWRDAVAADRAARGGAA